MARILSQVPRKSAVSTTTAVAFVLMLAACNDDGGSEDRAGSVTSTSTATTAEPSTTSTIEVTTTASPSGEPGPGCINGWTTPTAGTPLRAHPLDLIRAQMGVSGEFQVVEMRYFTGPEVPSTLEPRPPVVERWYVKAELAEEPTLRARWLVERRPQGEGIVAVARFDTAGYQSPDWRGFIGEGEPFTVDGIPGTWAGIEYDFVTGEGDSGNPGLPEEVDGCLDDT